MKFADTSYLLALLNPDDEFHAAATAWSGKLEEVILPELLRPDRNEEINSSPW